ncbi:MAG: hypothetical protein ABFD92_02035 [Planctomycetaceae bacterium]|nr:hypothetical protein [Planctomycetaceae bacterium]
MTACTVEIASDSIIERMYQLRVLLLHRRTTRVAAMAASCARQAQQESNRELRSCDPNRSV